MPDMAVGRAIVVWQIMVMERVLRCLSRNFNAQVVYAITLPG